MLCFPELLNGFVFSEAPTDAGLESNQSPGENQGNGADPRFDGNGQMEPNLWLWLPEEIRGICICLTVLLNVILSKYRTFLRMEDNDSIRKKGSSHMVRHPNKV